jgi:hypothetical protein
MHEQSLSLAIQLKITLSGIQPAVWRRVLVPSLLDLRKLHTVIQEVFGWEDYHIHAFQIRGESYGPEDTSSRSSPLREAVNLARLRLLPGETFTYEYDLGDSWVHELAVEEIMVITEPLQAPLCLDGQRACPPEDSGGPIGFPDRLEAARNPRHPDHKAALEFFEPDWDSEAFDLTSVNARLQKTFASKTRKAQSR